MLNYCVTFMLILAFTAHKGATVFPPSQNQDTQCREFGAVRLISNYLSNVGRVAFCDGSNWGTICCDNWDENDAAVVCRELGYTADGARPFHYDYDENIVIKDVNCDSNERRLRDCAYSNYTAMSDTCSRGGGAGVRCRAFKNVDVATVNVPYNTMPSVVVTWEYYRHNYSTLLHPTSFQVRCFSERHYTYTKLSVNNKTSTITIGGLLPFTSYNCCVSGIYYGYYTDEIQCTSVTENTTSAEMFISSDSNMRANTIGGVLGFIIVILVILLAICGGALLYLLRSRGVIPKRSSQHLDNNSTEMPVHRNISYIAAPSTTSRSQAIDKDGQDGAAAEYSRIGPSYETTVNSRRQQPVGAGRNRISARLSERYEFSEAHVAMASGGGGGGTNGETAMDYEIPLQSEEHEEYSRLQH